MPNEVLLIVFFLLLGGTNLVALKLWRGYLIVLIAVYTIIMNIFVIKQFDVFWLAITWWNALYGATFLATDLISEHHGKKEAYKSIFVGFMAAIIFVVSLQFLLWFQPNDFDFAHDSMLNLFSLTPRILLWSLLAFVVAQSIDVYLFNAIKTWTKWKYLFLRNSWSTLISQAIDTLIFTFIWLTTIWSFEWVIGLDIFWEVFLTTYAIKVLIAFLDTPFMYLSKKVLKGS
jgi:uncharacterized integral membrane protein (TIGR00697 family)